MRAAIYDQYGGPEVVRVEEIERPSPKRGEVLVRVHAATVSSGDWRMRSAEVPDGFGFLAPLIFGRRPKQRILGTELSGVIEEVGEGVSEWRAGDPVFAFPGAKMGAHAEYVCLPATGLICRKPASLSFEQAAALCFGGTTVLGFLESGGGVNAGERVLVVGASGAVGSAMVQLSKHYGAHVTGVCSASNAELVRSLGADAVVDYQREDFAAGTARYDLILDAIGTAPIAKARPLLNPSGRLLLVYSSFGDLLRSLASRRLVAGPARVNPKQLQTLAELAELGAFRPVIDATYPFEEVVEARRRVDSGRKRGSVVLKLAD